ARLLHGGADEQRPIVPWNEVTAAAPRHATKRRAVPGERQQLAADRPHRHARRDAVDSDVAGPAARRDDDGAARQRAAIGFDDGVAVASGDAADPARLD